MKSLSKKPSPLYLQHKRILKKIFIQIKKVFYKSAFIRGPFVGKFEKQFAKVVGAKYCISCGNGTDALYIALKAIGIKPGDEVITSAHSWISTSETISQIGAKVVFIDTDKDTFTINPTEIENKISKKTKAIVAVHLFGHPANMNKICRVAKKYKLKIIEDCAQAHLARFKNKHVGTFGEIGTFSFFPGKNLGAAGDAGCIVTNKKKHASFCRLFSDHGGKGIHVIEGINSRLDGIQAAILSLKLPFLKKWTLRRIAIAAKYSEKLKHLPNIILPITKKNCVHVFHQYTIKYPERDKLQKYLENKKIFCTVNYPVALPFLKAYRHLNLNTYNFPNAKKNQETLLCLPVYPELTEKEQNKIINAIKKFVKENIKNKLKNIEKL